MPVVVVGRGFSESTGGSHKERVDEGVKMKNTRVDVRVCEGDWASLCTPVYAHVYVCMYVSELSVKCTCHVGVCGRVCMCEDDADMWMVFSCDTYLCQPHQTTSEN